MSSEQQNTESTRAEPVVQADLVLPGSDASGPAPLPKLLLQSEELPHISLGIRVKLVALMVTTSFLIVGALASYFPARQISELRAGLRDRAATYGRLQ